MKIRAPRRLLKQPSRLRLCVKAFAGAILNGTEPPVGYADGLMALKLALAVERSAAEHRPVKIGEIEG